MLVVRLVVIVLVVGFHLAAMVVDKMKKMDWVKTVDEYYMEMEMLMQRGRVRESLEMTMQRFLNGLKYDVKGIVRHYTYTNMNQLLHHAREANHSWLKKQRLKDVLRELGVLHPVRLLQRGTPSTLRSLLYSPSKPVSNVSNTKKSESAVRVVLVCLQRATDMLCHTCGGKGHFKRDCPNRKVMFINEDNEYETGDDVDPNAPDDDDYDTDGEDAYPSDARTIVVSQRALNVLPSASTQRCNLFQTKALVGPDKACKVIIDGGSCRNLASGTFYQLCPFEVVYGFKPITPLDLLPLPIHERVNMEASKRADFVKKIHVKTKELIEKKGKSNAARMNKKRKEMLFKPGDLVWVHFHKDRYEEKTSITRGEEQLDVKMDVKLDMELDMKISHGRARGAGGMRERRRRSPAGRNPATAPRRQPVLPTAANRPNRRECIARRNRKLRFPVAARLTGPQTG
ncbi:hypothetical protein QYE76_003464 [Lolium multiflorum]|uniref:CCHC-type domain-containing protein n=1 Tax=Lolium multiflorum TaxID=4521 RepID=A0AAD8W0H4_LOLMU|nr:hypothetical protein QYE76_003464 [Lolium multiflorum]